MNSFRSGKWKLYAKSISVRSSSTASKIVHPSVKDDARNKKILASTAAVLSSTLVGCSMYSRQWREGNVNDVPLAIDSGAFFVQSKGGNDGTTCSEMNQSTGYEKRNIHDIDSLMQRTGLMGKIIPGSKSVKEELHAIRSWHQERDFRGGVIVRELTRPLFKSLRKDEELVIEGGDDVEPMPIEQLPQRECYYLYYEVKGNGHVLQQIFCRGTTLLADVKTCLNSHFVYDEDLGIHLHAGFRDHAQRLVEDVEPLLAHPSNTRATIEVSGHSLGGAVAMIVAMKLKKKGYRVQKVMSVAGARFSAKEEIHIVNSLLPLDALRIEDDLDCVPFLPPWASSAGDKLWFVNMRSADKPKVSVKYIPRTVYLENEHELSWTDKVFTNLRLPETIKSENVTHRIRSHREKLSTLVDPLMEQNIPPSVQQEDV